MVDWDDFKEELEARIVDIPLPEVLTAEVQFQEALKNLMEML